MTQLQVDVEASRADRKAFIELPHRLYRKHPYWVPQPRLADKALMNRRKNPFFAHADAQHFLARRDGRVVGRIAAVENRRHNDTHEDRVGFFGFFDVEEGDQDAATALVDAARTWLSTRDLAPMRGPVNYSTNDTCGVLLDGFDEAPTLLMPYNRPDYDALLRGAGLTRVKELLAFWISSANPVPERFERVVTRRLGRTGTLIRPIDTAQFDREIRLLRDLYNRTWERNWSFVPATDAEFDHAAKDMKMLVEPDVSGVAERDGAPVAFSVFLRDINPILKRMDGRVFPFGWLKLLLGIKRVKRLRCILLGVVPEARGGALNEALFIRAMKQAARMGIEGAEAGWVLADNRAMRAPIEAAGGKVTKRYAMYEG